MDKPALITITIIALVGGLLGVFFMVPLRSALIVKEHGVLPYPEGTACAEVLLAGEKGGSSAKSVFIGMAIGAVIKFVTDGLCAVRSVVSFKLFVLSDLLYLSNSRRLRQSSLQRSIRRLSL